MIYVQDDDDVDEILELLLDEVDDEVDGVMFDVVDILIQTI